MDWDELRRKSLLPGGFGEERIRLWPQILHAACNSPPESPDDSQPHADERQIRLDTDRSFVLYPVGESLQLLSSFSPNNAVQAPKDRPVLQQELYELIITVFRRRPRLSYFQGFHDIVTVLFLTLPKELQLPCVEQLSLHRVRDAMGSSLEPVLGLLRVLQKLLRIADPPYAELLERYSHFPYFALPNLLTLFSHDMPTLPLIQHVFDYILSRPPIIVVYLVAAVTLSRKPEVLRLEEEGEEGMLHSLLSALPDITDQVEEEMDPLADESESEVETEPLVEESSEVKDEPQEPLVIKEESLNHLMEDATIETRPDLKQEEKSVEPLLDRQAPAEESTHRNPDPLEDPQNPIISITNTDTETPSEPPIKHLRSKSSIPTIPSLPSTPRTPSPSASPKPSRSPSPEPKQEERAPRFKIALSTLLAQADTLYSTYPPTHPSLTLSQIMGPQSVVFTWSENRAEMPPDLTAERIVQNLSLIVHPDPDAPSSQASKEIDTKLPKERKRRRKLHKRLDLQDRKTILTGAVIALGVAMAVYGVRSSGLVGDARHSQQEWKKLTKWIAGLLVGLGERVLSFTEDL